MRRFSGPLLTVLTIHQRSLVWGPMGFLNHIEIISVQVRHLPIPFRALDDRQVMAKKDAGKKLLEEVAASNAEQVPLQV